MKLIGSTTSPYVRKIRLILDNHNFKYEFEKIQALSPEGIKVLESYGSILRVPILIIENQKIFDSTIIAEHLLDIKGVKLSTSEKLQLRLIDELCDSGVTLLQQKLWKIDPDWVDERSKKVFKRYSLILNELEKNLEQLNEFQKDWLFCVLDWLLMRSLLEWDGTYNKLEDFYNINKSREQFVTTDPRI